MDFFSSDFHINHARILIYCPNRPGLTDQEQKWLIDGVDFRPSWESVGRMNKYLIDNINAVVQPNDTLWFLGDLLFAPNHIYRQKAEEVRARLAAKKVHFVTGNHDRVDKLGGLFESISVRKEIVINKKYIVMDHFPMLSWNRKSYNSWCFHAHSHGSLESWKKIHMPAEPLIDVGIDCWNYKPVSFDELVKAAEERIKNKI